MPPGLADLERTLARDMEMLSLPARSWTARRQDQDGSVEYDVVVVGAGMCGIAAAGALRLRGITNLVVLERAQQGMEGPWTTTARMRTLRSPKHLPGVDLGLPALTFRAWYTAREGEAAWLSLGKIANQDWMDYLFWVRRVLELPVRNDSEAVAIRPGDRHLAVHVRGGDVLTARRVVLATGRLGVGGPYLPPGIDRALGPDRVAHASQVIDFAALAGCRVAVLGGGPSAWDNAATALEAGASAVDLYVRRAVLPQVNKLRASATVGFFEGWAGLAVADRWRLVCFLDDHETPPPHESVLRVAAQPGFTAHLGTPVLQARASRHGVDLTLGPDGRHAAADFLLAATGYAVDLRAVPELADLAPHAATWGDAYQPPAGLERPERAAFPFLGDGFELTERVPGSCPALRRVHLFNHGAFASLGAIASDIPGVSSGAERLASSIVQAFFAEDIGHIMGELAAYDEPELAHTPFFSAEQVAAQRNTPVWPSE
jgi:FAD-dependent urate hydroxylase